MEQKKEKVTTVSLNKLKAMFGADEFRVVDSKEGKRSSVYGEDGRVGLVKQGMTASDLAADVKNVICVKHETIGWVFTVQKGTIL